MSVQQKPQSRRTSHSPSSVAGEIMSPKISTESFIDPIQADRSCTDDGGITSATGVPWRVMQIGFLVLRTRSSTARHFALNSEIAISSMKKPPMVIIMDHGHNSGQPLSSALLLKPIPGLARRRKLLLRRRRLRPRLFLQLQQQRQICLRRRLQNFDRLLPINRSIVRRQMLILLAVVIVNVRAYY